MYRTSKSRIKNISKDTFNLISEMSSTAKNLYNATLYTVRQHYFETNEYLNFFKTYPIMKSNENHSSKFLRKNELDIIIDPVEFLVIFQKMESLS